MSDPSVAAGERGAVAYRTVRTQPVVFSQVDNRTLFYGNNVLWKTIDGGINWTQVSPDLTRETWSVPKNVGTYAPRVQNTKRGGIGAQVIYTIGPSYKDINRIWIGTDDGVIATTADGGLHWTNVTPPGVTDFMKVFTIDPGRFDPLTAYAAVNTLRLDDMNPHIYRTHDGGKTWKEIVTGIPGGAPVSVVREDPKRQGTAVRRLGDAGLRVVRRRRSLAVAAPEHGGVVRSRSGDQGRRPRGGHARARHLDPGQHHAASSDQRGNRAAGRRALQAADRLARALEHEHGHAAAARRADGAESARGRHHRLLPEVGGVRPGDARDPRRRRPSCGSIRATTRCSGRARRRARFRCTGSASR